VFWPSHALALQFSSQVDVHGMTNGGKILTSTPASIFHAGAGDTQVKPCTCMSSVSVLKAVEGVTE
jgi:hypothetical protein